MASRSRRSSGGGQAKSIFGFLVVAGMIFAFFQVPYDPGAKGIQEIMVSKSKSVEQWVNGIAPSIAEKAKEIIRGGSSPVENGGFKPPAAPAPGNGGNPPAPAPPAAGGLEAQINSIAVGNETNANYNRDEWKHWNNIRGCWSVREQVLAVEAVPGSAVMKDGNGKPTSDINAACTIESGKWVDVYSGKTFTNPKELDIDHMIPLNYAAQHGGQAWDSGKKQNYANNLDYADHLIAVSAKENRTKSDKGPSEWKPTDKGYWCKYSEDWAAISVTWGLTATAKDVAALKEMAATC
jgi:hypothetical protein